MTELLRMTRRRVEAHRQKDARRGFRIFLYTLFKSFRDNRAIGGSSEQCLLYTYGDILWSLDDYILCT